MMSPPPTTGSSARQANPAMMRSRDAGGVQTFGRRETVDEIDAEPQLRPPPRWLIILAGVAIAALMGAMLGAFMHV